MIWTVLDPGSHLTSLLNEKDVVLEEVLDDEEVLAECKVGNQKLTDYLVDPNIFDELINLITNEPAECEDERYKYKYSNIACEVLISDNQAITEALSRESVRYKLYAFFNVDHELNPLLASFVCKVLKKIFNSFNMEDDKCHILLSQCENLVNILVKHITTSSVMSFILSNFTPAYTNIQEFYMKAGLIPLLIDCFKKGSEPRALPNVAELLGDIIRTYREQDAWNNGCGDYPIINEIESTETVTKLLENMFENRSEICLVSGLDVLLSLLEYKRPNLQAPRHIIPSTDPEISQDTPLETIPKCISQPQLSIGDMNSDISNDEPSEDIEKLFKSAPKIHAAIIPRLKDFRLILLNPPPKNPVKTPVGVIEEPFGATRIKIAELVKALLFGNNSKVNKALEEAQIMPLLLDFFFKYPHNNFLHTQVEQSIQCILKNSKSSSPIITPEKNQKPDISKESAESLSGILKQLIVEKCLLNKILEHVSEPLKANVKLESPRPSYIGHLINIANYLTANYEVPAIKTILYSLDQKTLEAWDEFVKGPFNALRLLLGSPLVQETTEFETGLEEKAFMDYQVQEMTRDLTCNLNWEAAGINPREYQPEQDQYLLPR